MHSVYVRCTHAHLYIREIVNVWNTIHTLPFCPYKLLSIYRYPMKCTLPRGPQRVIVPLPSELTRDFDWHQNLIYLLASSLFLVITEITTLEHIVQNGLDKHAFCLTLTDNSTFNTILTWKPSHLTIFGTPVLLLEGLQSFFSEITAAEQTENMPSR